MRLINIFLLNSQQVVEQRTRALVWFLVSLFNPVVFLLFWRGALKTTISNWSLSNISAYYFLMIIAASLLTSHIEDDIASVDIMEGNLSAHLLRPFSYFWINFFRETPMRILQGCMGILTLFLFIVIFGNFFTITKSPTAIFLSTVIAILAYLLSFTMKTILGITAFWVVDIEGLFQIVDMIIWIFAGYVMPLALFPTTLQKIAYVLPFSYTIYFPIIAFQGKLSTIQLLQVIGLQIFWLMILGLLYKYLWKKGLQKFTAVGQ